MNRTQKIKNLELSLSLMEDKTFSVDASYTSLNGPTLTVKTPSYTGVVSVEFGGSSIVRFAVDGYTQRFAEPAAFLRFFTESLVAPSQAVLDVAAQLPGSQTIGANTIVYRSNNSTYMLTKVQHGFEVKYNNDKILLSASDAVKTLLSLGA